MKHLITTILTCFALYSYGQMGNGQDTLYGNEWINYEQSYFKIKIAEDGIYRLPYELMQQAGIPLAEIPGQQYQLFHLGRQVPLYLSNTGTLGPGDYLEFYGQKNRSEMDRYLYRDPETSLLNPEYSLYTDSAAYFLTWTTVGNTTFQYQTIPNELTNLPAAEPWYWAVEKRVFNNRHFKNYQKFGVTDIYYSHYDGDGFARNYDNNFQVDLPTPAVYSAGPEATVSMSMISNASVNGHFLNIRLNDNLVLTDTFYSTNVSKHDFPLNTAGLNESVRLHIKGETSGDGYALALAKVKYPRQFRFPNKGIFQLDLPAGPNPRYLEIEGPTGSPMTILEPATGIRIQSTVANGVHKVKLPAAPGVRHLVLQNNVAAVAVDTLIAVDFKPITSTGIDFAILSNHRLFTDSVGNNWVQAYADYRASAAGGSHRTEVVDVEQLYDQFGYGIGYHPQAIRNAFQYLKRFQWPELSNIFIIGKGQEYNGVRAPENLRTAVAAGLMQVPSFGYPASDNLLIAPNEMLFSPIPIGRLAVVTSSEVELYLDKVKTMEQSLQNEQNIPEKAWMKRLMHLGGGKNGFEQSAIRSYLESMALEIENNSFGGNVQPFYKTSTDPIQTSLSEQIFETINDGVGMITFFGHSSPGTFDFNIDNPDNYSNFAKYPLMLSLGCYSGNIFTQTRSISERFTFYENKGAIVFGATRGVGFLNYLGQFASRLYENLGTDKYGAGIGEVLRATFEQYGDSEAIGLVTLIEQFTLHGDPSISVYPAPGPDYTIDPETVSFQPELISAQQDSFTLSFDLVNLGRHLNDTFAITISQQLPSAASLDLVRDTVAGPEFSSRLSYRLPIFGKDMVGLNTYFIRVDVDDEVTELPAPAAEANNELVSASGSPGIPIYVVDNTARPVYPADFALVGDAAVTLKASTTDAFAPERNYIFEIDTTIHFDSPLKRRKEILQIGGVIEWQPEVGFRDSTVYYWRVSPDSTNALVGYTWDVSSFTYLNKGPNGWGQGHFWQWQDNRFTNMEWPKDNRKLKYLDDFKDIRVTQGVFPDIRPEIAINNTPYLYIPWDNPTEGGITVSVLDSVTVEPWINQTGTGLDDGQYGSDLPYWLKDYAIFPYRTRTPEQRRTLINFLDSIVPPNNYVVLITTQTKDSDYEPHEWAADSLENNGRNLFNLLEEQGAQLIRSTETTGAIPYYFVYKKDDPSFEPYEGFGSTSAVIVRNVDLPGVWDNGSMRSPRIGPAKKWESLSWNLRQYDLATDSFSFNVYGIQPDSAEVLLIEQATGTSADLSEIDAQTYPYLRLRFNSADTTFRTSPQLDFWHIRYEGLPDLALNPARRFAFNADTLQQGESITLELAIENISKYDVDSVLVRFTTVDQQNNRNSLDQRIAPIPAGEAVIARQEIDSRDLYEKYDLIVEANPEREPAETFYFNNLGIENFFVESDKKGPILDVTFDGIHILNGDLVSAKPLIRVDLVDENDFLPLVDTSSFQLYLKYPGASTAGRIPLNSNIVSFFPANPDGKDDKNKASIELNPNFLIDGTYELEVRAQDASGNASGAYAYRIAFEIITKSMISNVINYPNPFSTSTQFVYTLTGDRPPEQYRIQIMTVSGRIVKTILPEELGPLRIGTHKTEYTWDGTDDFGDRLANGIYLYRFIATDSTGQEFEHYGNSIDRFFEKGFGKLVILR